MKSCFSPLTTHRFSLNRTLRAILARGWPALLLVAWTSPVAAAQDSSSSPDPDKQTIQMLLQRIDQLEAKVARLESKQEAAPTTSAPAPTASAPGAGQASTPSGTPSETETGLGEMPERMDLSKTLLRIRGFGDITLHGDNQEGDHTSFTLGQLNLFVTSDISEKFRFLSEIVFEAGPDNFYGVPTGTNNSFSVDVERYLLQYSYNDYFNLAIGRYHTAIGYYNTAYHHSTWFQTTQGRPLLFQFEDRGGILPIHNVGVSASGQIPSGSLGLHYVAEVGNGRESRSPLTAEPVQNTLSDKNHKAFNLAVFARPESLRGLQAGFSVYRDLQTPFAAPAVTETILAAHAVFIRPTFEWLNEALVVRHTPLGMPFTFNTPGFYSQISKRFGPYRPYFRYQYINASSREPIFPDVGLQAGPSVGVRYDWSESVAVKLQYDYNGMRQQPAVNSLGLQVGFTF
jgi:hypothetical protein